MKQLIILFILFFLISLGPLTFPHGVKAQEQMLQWKGYALTTTPTWDARTLSADIVVSRFDFTVKDMPAGSVYDICVFSRRLVDPKYPDMTGGYSENLCWHIGRRASGGNASFSIDLRGTPLFYPKDTEIACGVGGLRLSGNGSPQTTPFTCSASYHAYSQGEKRFRTLRFPYVDMQVNPDGSIPVNYYQSTTIFPLIVRNAFLFQAFGDTGTSVPCLKWVRQGGVLVNQACMPAQSVSPGQNDESYSASLPLNWNIPPGDLLTATCQNSRAGTDCGIYAVVQIPDNIIVSPENTFRDYQNVASAPLRQFCEQYVQAFTHYYFCNGQPACNAQTKIQKCTELFPIASCIATNTCTEKLGDLNSDGKVDIFDYNLLIGNFGKTGSNLAGDIDKNGKVDIFDYNELVGNFGK